MGGPDGWESLMSGGGGGPDEWVALVGGEALVGGGVVPDEWGGGRP